MRCLLSPCVLAAVACGTGVVPATPSDPVDAGPPVSYADAGEVRLCSQTEPVVVEEAAPDLLLVVDRSGSMGYTLDGVTEKWPVMEEALGSIVTEYQHGIRFGLSLYPAAGDICGPGSVDVETSPNNGGAIIGALNGASPSGNTPTHTTLAAALDYFQSIPVNPDGRYLLLATDGLPNCNGTAQAESIDESVAAVQALADEGIATFVLGFGGNINSSPDTLAALAAAGGAGPFFQANSSEELADALEAIAVAIEAPPCTFPLEEAPERPELVVVFLDGVELDRDTPNGWSYDATDNTINLAGEACTRVQSGEVSEVLVDWGCGIAECLKDEHCPTGEFCQNGLCHRPVD